MAASDFVKATSFKLRDAAVQDDKTINLRATSTAVPAPGTLIVGSRFFIQYAPTNRDYYAVLNAVVPVIATGVSYEWVGVQITPAVRRDYDADDLISFEPWAVIKKPFPSTVSVKENESGSLNLGDYFELRGGSGSIHYIVKSQGPGLKTSVSGSTLIYKGTAEGVVRLSVEARDSSQGTVSQVLSVSVLHANRRPRSLKALGNPSLTVGGSISYDLATYFVDDDGDTLSFVAGGGGGYASVLVDGPTLTISGLDVGQVTISVDASDGTLEIAQQMRITVSANRRPIVSKIIPHQAITVGGNPVVLNIDDYFSDPDAGNVLSWLVQFEEGDPAHQYRQEFWSVTAKTGSNQLTLESLYRYPPGSDAPWGSGTAWSAPAGTSFTFRSAFGTDPLVSIFRGSTLSTAVASWDGTARRVLLTLRSAETLPAGSISPPSRVIFGDAVVWAEGDHMNLNLIPGDILGTRNLYVSAFDNLGLFASQIFPVTLHHAPTPTPVPDQVINVGETFSIALGLVFAHLDADPLVYTIQGYDNVIIQPRIIKNTLQVTGLTNGNSDLLLIAQDEHNHTILNTIAFQVNAVRPENDRASLVPEPRWRQIAQKHGRVVQFESATAIVVPERKKWTLSADAAVDGNSVEIKKHYRVHIPQADNTIVSSAEIPIPVDSVFAIDEERFTVFGTDSGASLSLAGFAITSANYIFLTDGGIVLSLGRASQSGGFQQMFTLAAFPSASWRGIAILEAWNSSTPYLLAYDASTGFIRAWDMVGNRYSSLDVQGSPGGRDMAAGNTPGAKNIGSSRMWLLFDDKIEAFLSDDIGVLKTDDITMYPQGIVTPTPQAFASVVGIAYSGRNLIMAFDTSLQKIVGIPQRALNFDDQTFRQYDIDTSSINLRNPSFLSAEQVPGQSSTDPYVISESTDGADQIYRFIDGNTVQASAGTQEYVSAFFSPPLTRALVAGDNIIFIDTHTLASAVPLRILFETFPSTFYLADEIRSSDLIGYVLPSDIPAGTTLDPESRFSVDGKGYRIINVEHIRYANQTYVYRFTASLVPN